MHSKRWLKTLETVPPGGWVFIDPDTQLKMTATNFERLKNQVFMHRTYQGSNRENYPDEIEHQICDRIPESWSQDKPRKNNE